MKKGMKEMMEEMKSSDMPKQMSEKDIQAKKEMLMELLGFADSELKGKAKSKLDEARAMKVAVMAKDKEGLMEGLEKAEDILEGEMPEMEDSEEEMESEEQEVKPEPLMEEKEEIKPALMEDEEDSFFKKKKR